MQALGGLRHARKDSPNAGWRNASFGGCADYMQTEQFQAALDRLIQLSREKRVAIMCAEEIGAEADRGFAVSYRRNVRPGPLLASKLPDPVGVAAAIRERRQRAPRGDAIVSFRRPMVNQGLSFRRYKLWLRESESL